MAVEIVKNDGMTVTFKWEGQEYLYQVHKGHIYMGYGGLCHQSYEGMVTCLADDYHTLDTIQIYADLLGAKVVASRKAIDCSSGI